MPYLFLYGCVVSTSTITPENLQEHMRSYPYDRILFHPGYVCRTCHTLKPARSKHCSICNDALVLTYSSTVPAKHWAEGTDWAMYFQLWGFAIADDIVVGAVFLLAVLTAPLPFAMLLYHLYLIWSGMTTNESAKWGDWRDDIADGLVFKAKKSEIYPQRHPDADIVEPDIPWPINTDHTLIFTSDGSPPRVGFSLDGECTSITQPGKLGTAPDPRWRRVQRLEDVVNVYDLGFWSNLREALRIRR
ncbi:hypothetical protein ACO22_03795 [Paracoccidioides brasiliensis]|uniref:protein S-acyltransferase n=1 Tax=Paracoccidioides brasiliensis TaxID=121759 RepID=A0A1D2JEW9_PARBR|nr:hypothetical protein ACO22_03795 [Paracoccidioides brasiliensis]